MQLEGHKKFTWFNNTFTSSYWNQWLWRCYLRLVFLLYLNRIVTASYFSVLGASHVSRTSAFTGEMSSVVTLCPQLTTTSAIKKHQFFLTQASVEVLFQNFLHVPQVSELFLPLTRMSITLVIPANKFSITRQKQLRPEEITLDKRMYMNNCLHLFVGMCLRLSSSDSNKRK